MGISRVLFSSILRGSKTSILPRSAQAICKHCELRCLHSRGYLRQKEGRTTHWDVLLEHETLLLPSALIAALADTAAAGRPRSLRLVHMPSNQFSAALSYVERGEILSSVARSELIRAQLPAHLSAAGLRDATWTTLPVESSGSNDSHALAEFASNWRQAVSALGVARSELDRLVKLAVRLRKGWSRERFTPKWQGCFKDRGGEYSLVHIHDCTIWQLKVVHAKLGQRAMLNGPRTFGHTTQACAAACTGFAYFALQNGGQCFCAQTSPKVANHSKVRVTSRARSSWIWL